MANNQNAEAGFAAAPGSAADVASECKHLIAYADERDAKPCPVCELTKLMAEHEHLSKALVDLQVKLVDLRLPVLSIEMEVSKIKERLDAYQKFIFSVQKRHGHLKPPNDPSSPTTGKKP